MSKSRTRVLVPGKIHQRVIDRLAEQFEVIRIESADPALVMPDMQDVKAVAVAGRLPGALIDALPQLEIIANFGVGYDGVEVAHAAAKGIAISNTPEIGRAHV